MSKAFTKETDTEEEEPDSPDPLPQGFKNYVTPRGLKLLRDELDELRRVEIPERRRRGSDERRRGLQVVEGVHVCLHVRLRWSTCWTHERF